MHILEVINETVSLGFTLPYLVAAVDAHVLCLI